MHGNQVCVPDATLLPVGVDRIYPAGDKLAAAGELRYCATERHQDGDTYTYDIAVRMAVGPVVERWEGLRLRAVRKDAGRGPWVIPLLGPYLERAVADLTGTPVAVAVEPHADATGRVDRREMTALAACRALGRQVPVRYRPDGRPETDGGEVISASHGPGLTLCVAAKSLVSCDTQAVEHRAASAWLGLLGSHEGLARLLASESGEEYDAAATRVWAAIECLHKAGLPQSAPLIASPSARPGWQVLNCGPLRIATFVTTLRDVKGQVAFAVLTEEGRS
jgi:enediyne polyketide synthase